MPALTTRRRVDFDLFRNPIPIPPSLTGIKVESVTNKLWTDDKNALFLPAVVVADSQCRCSFEKFSVQRLWALLYLCETIVNTDYGNVDYNITYLKKHK
jgi:hypothetical protein